MLAEVVTDKQEGGDPDHRAAIGVERESAILELGSARDDGGEMPEAGDEVSNHERPVSHAIKPIVHARNLTVVDMQKPAQPRVEKLPSHGAPNDVAAGNSAGAAGERAGRGWNQVKMPLKYQESAACQQELIRDRQAHDAEDQQREDRGIAID